MTWRPSLRAALALLAVSCSGREVRPASSGPAVDPGTVAGRVALELWQLRGGVNLATWSSANLNDQLAGPDSAYGGNLGVFCARGVQTLEVGGHTVVREAYFYPPPPPRDLALPDSGTPDLIRDCVLGMVRIVVPVGDSAAGAALADTVRGQLEAAFGPARAGPVSFYRSAFWVGTARFTRDSLTAVSAFEATPATGERGVEAGRVQAIAVLPGSGLALGGPAAAAAAAYAPEDSVPVDSAVALARLDSTLWVPLRALLRDARPWTGERHPADSLIRPLSRWVNAAAALPPSRRAAALYVADAVLDRTACAFPLCEHRDSLNLRPLRALGATFDWNEFGGSWTYARSWLAQARALDRDSPLGQRIFLAQLARGMDFSSVCAGGAEGFRAVIQEGRRFLARAVPGQVAGDVEFLVGEAYRDIVALAAGAGDVYADASLYTGEATSARREAIAHYRAAMETDPAGPVAGAAWRRAWWLLAGLAPRETRFYCVYD